MLIKVFFIKMRVGFIIKLVIMQCNTYTFIAGIYNVV